MVLGLIIGFFLGAVFQMVACTFAGHRPWWRKGDAEREHMPSPCGPWEDD